MQVSSFLTAHEHTIKIGKLFTTKCKGERVMALKRQIALTGLHLER